MNADIRYYGGAMSASECPSGDILEVTVPSEAWDDDIERTLFAEVAYDDEGREEEVFGTLCELVTECIEALAPKLISPVTLELSGVSAYSADDVTIKPAEGEVDDDDADDGFFYRGNFLHGKDLAHCFGRVDAYVRVTT